MQINGQPVKETDLAGALDRHLQDARDQGGVREGRSGSGLPYVAQAIDDAKGAGLDKVGIMTPKVEAGQ